MKILLLQAEIRFYSAFSLKDKRSVLKRIIDRLRTRLNVTVAEIDHHDEWQLATIAIITVSMLESRVEKTIQACIKEIELSGDVEILAENREWL
ncbi:MAG: DUF503 domain-containing protein [Sumerlaeia bacterium]